MPRALHSETEWLLLPGKTLAEIEAAAIRSAFLRHGGNRTRMRAELKISRMGLLRKLDLLGLRGPRKVRHLREIDIARAFQKHRKAIAAELKIRDSTLMRWLNSKAPFAVEE